MPCLRPKGTAEELERRRRRAVGLLNKGCGIREVARRVGAFIGDFAKIGINSSLSTGSVIGFGTNLAISTFNNQFITSFKFITDNKDERYDVERCLAVAKKAMARRNVEMSSEEEAHFRDLCSISLENESV